MASDSAKTLLIRPPLGVNALVENYIIQPLSCQKKNCHAICQSFFFSILIYFLAFLPSVCLRLSCSSRWTYGYDFWYITCISVSMPTPWAVAGPNGQLASITSATKILQCFFCGTQLNLVAFKNPGKWLCWIDHCHALPSTAAGKLQDLPADVCLHVTELEWPLQNLHATCRKEYQVMASCRFLLFVCRKKKVDSFFPSLAFTYQLMYRHVAYRSMIKLVCRTWVFHFSSERRTSLYIESLSRQTGSRDWMSFHHMSRPVPLHGHSNTLHAYMCRPYQCWLHCTLPAD